MTKGTIGRTWLRLASMLLLSSAALAPLLADGPSPEAIQFFESRIRPLLIERCYKCHSVNSRKLKGDLLLDSRATLLKGGENGIVIVPGEPEKSRLIKALKYENPDLQMPPKSRLAKKAIDDITQWVKMGIPWPKEAPPKARASAVREEFNLQERRRKQWCFQPLRSPEPAAAPRGNWSSSPIDQFILRGLAAKGLTPSQAADQRILIRRATFDTIGLPPIPADIDAFLKDDSPEAFENVIDRLLDSPHFGEKWARHWMDSIRYSESRGHEFDHNHPNAFQYRDYLIRAFNADVPYKDFVTEHVAGDLIPEPRRHPKEGFNESILGTGFWFLGEWVHSPVDIRGDECDRMDNMVDVFSKTFLAQTLSCARCHDHKFDAISQKDYYAFAGFLQSSTYRQARFETLDHNRKIAEELAALRKKHQPQVLQAVAAAQSPVVDNLAGYLLASREVLQAGSIMESKFQAVLFEDFESGTFNGWMAKGGAFSGGPHTQQSIAKYQGDLRAQGRFFVNSHNQRVKGKVKVNHTDHPQGTLTSPKFRIRYNFVSFLIGGGAHKRRTCVNLLIDGRAVLSSTGRNNNQMHQECWDVRKFRGKTAQIQMVDKVSGGWGNIGLDHVVFEQFPNSPLSNLKVAAAPRKPKPDLPDGTERLDREDREESIEAELGVEKEKEEEKPEPDPFAEFVSRLAEKYQLDAERLESWIVHLFNAKNQADDFFHTWALVANMKEPKPEAIAGLVKKFADRQRQLKKDGANKARVPEGSEVFVDYSKARPEDWIQDGNVFGTRPVQPGDIQFGTDRSQPIIRIQTRHAAKTDPIWSKLALAGGTLKDPGSIGRVTRAGRTLRTPTFTVNKKGIYYLARGSGHAFAVVDSHQMVAGPLHGRTIMDIRGTKDGKPGWRRHDLNQYKGHRVHIEFTPKSDCDLEILMAVQSDENPGTLARANELLLETFSGPELTSPETLATAYQELFGQVNRKLAAGVLSGGPESADFADVANMMLARPNLFLKTNRLDKAQELHDFFNKQRELIGRIRFSSRTAPALWDGSAEDEFLLVRGNHKTPSKKVRRRFIESFAGSDPLKVTRGSGRLDLAKQMTDPNITPVVPRVMVNRIWHHLFGRGIVPTVDDFGNMGRPPSHPELLDFLATLFVKNGWSVKKIIKTVMLSSTYRMSSRPGGKGDAVDPKNLLLHRMPIRRLTSEVIRDSILAVSGRLDRKMFGSPVNVHLTAQMQGRGRPRGGPLDGAGRRSIYIAIRRNFLSPMMLAFDTPIPFSSMGRRNVSNVPSQALILMNDPFVVQQAKHWAGRLISKKEQKPEERIGEMYKTAFARKPTGQELTNALAFLDSQSKLYKKDKNSPEVWGDLGHILFNVKEFIYLN